MIELPVRKSIRAGLTTQIEERGEKFYMEQILTNSNDKKFVVTQDAPVYLLQKSEIEQFAKEAGFSNVEFFSGFTESPYTAEANTLVAEISA